MKAIEAAGYRPGEQIALGLDAAASEFFKGGKYAMEGEGKTLDAAGMVKFYQDLVARYPIMTIEDGMAEDDWEGWAALTAAIGGKVQVVGDDVFVTNSARLRQGSSAASPTRSWSRSIRSGRSRKRWRPWRSPTRPAIAR